LPKFPLPILPVAHFSVAHFSVAQISVAHFTVNRSFHTLKRRRKSTRRGRRAVKGSVFACGKLTTRPFLPFCHIYHVNETQLCTCKACCWRSRRRGSGGSVIDDIDFPMAILAYFFSRRRIASNQRYCHMRQTICSTRFGVRVCLLVLWSNNFQPPFHRLPKFKIFHCKMRFFAKITHLL